MSETILQEHKQEAGQVTIRDMREEDIQQIVDEFNNTWSMKDSDGDDISALDAQHFVMHYLSGTTRGRVAQMGGRFMGVTLLSVDQEPLVVPDAASRLEAVDAQLKASAEGSKNLANMRVWHRLEEDVEAGIGINESAQAELKLFLVSSRARGHGVGGKLWRDMLAHLDERDVERFYLHTDSSCDVSFYDHIGMECLAARMGADHPEEADDRGGFYDDIFVYASPVSQQLDRWGLSMSSQEPTSDGGGAR
ncbi:N-acetyltransferase [Bombiscardovia nodaiensis]|uniref:N-acetyltransferase n=1 Tax=Bombiscardovia nodaiensis TaxID=2932181 RepID=A0ABM8B9C0_9BIFI|nr:N-acetyltransferase [Bombiscardovia nodaiensis]